MNGSVKSEEMTRQVREIFDKLDDPVEREKAFINKQRDDILKEKLEDYNI